MMKKFLCANLILLVIALLGVRVELQAQPTWTLDETVLNEYTLVSGVNIPWELTWGPDNMLWCTTREGNVLRIDPASGAYEIILELNVNDSGTEPGLLGMALHPNWENQPQVFLVYTAYDFQNGNHERLSVFDWNGTSLVNEEILHVVDASSIHNGSRLLVLPDNTLLMSTGDVYDRFNTSQNLDSDNGKILRFNLDGTVPQDNPIANSPIFSFGHRNSQGLCLGPDGIVYSSEHGQYNFDEFNILEANGNFGWPNVEGMCDGACDWCSAGNEISFCENNNVIEPLRTWSPCAAVSDIVYYDHPAIPEWQGSVLMAVLGGFGDSVGGRLNVLHMSEDGLSLLSDEHFFSSFNQRIRDVAVNPITGAVYLALNGAQTSINNGYSNAGPNLIKELRPASMDVVEDWAETRGVDVFPNPALDHVTFEVSESWSNSPFQIVDVNGEILHSGIFEPGMRIDVSHWASGAYILQSSAVDGKRLSRVLVIK